MILRLLFFLYLDWRVDGDPEHEIKGNSPQVAQGALTMVSCSIDVRETDNCFFWSFRLNQKSVEFMNIWRKLSIIKLIIDYAKQPVVHVLKISKNVYKFGH